jgi:hypothetical protein
VYETSAVLIERGNGLLLSVLLLLFHFFLRFWGSTVHFLLMKTFEGTVIGTLHVTLFGSMEQ